MPRVDIAAGRFGDFERISPFRQKGPTGGTKIKRCPKTIDFWRGRLPHWEVEEGRYFITIHLNVQFPLRDGIEFSCCHISRRSCPFVMTHGSNFNAASFGKWKHGSIAQSRRRNCADGRSPQMVVDAVKHREQRGDWHIFEFAVMPSHIHLFLEFVQGRLKGTMNDFKRWTGHQAGKMLGQDGNRFWQREWFDHWSRSDEEDDKIVRYIRDNPVKGGLVSNYLDWPYGSRAK